jgi:hypothetical protein
MQAFRTQSSRVLEEWETSIPQRGMYPRLHADVQVAHETQRRASVLRMELLHWRVVHGNLPERLSELQSSDAAVDIRDPYSGSAFVYRRDGFGLEMDATEGGTIPPHHPFLWSTGLHLASGALMPGQEESLAGRTYYRYPAGSSGHVRINSEQELFASGWCFRIPASDEHR